MNYNTDGLVPIQKYLRQLDQRADEAEWGGNFPLADQCRSEKQHVTKYHEDTGSVYYPMF